MGVAKVKKPSTAAATKLLKAQEQLRATTTKSPAPGVDDESKRLLQELQVHQIELEMQNAELLRVQEELERSRNQYYELYDYAPIGYFIVDAQGLITEVNLAGAKLLGIDRGLLLNKQFVNFIAEEADREIFAQHREKTFQQPGSQTCEVWLKRKGGAVFYAQLQSVANEHNDVGPGYLRTTMIDISALKKAEVKIEQAAALQSAIFNSANFSSIATDAQGVIQIFNVGAERMLGYTAAEVLNTITPADISDPQEVIARAEVLSRELGTSITPGFEALVFKASRGIEDIYELTYIRKDGSRFPAVVSVTALRDEQETIIGYLLIGTDNTARKQIEAEQAHLSQRLRDHQFYTRSLFESNIDAIMTTDPSGIITDVNKQMEVLTGCTRDELIGAPFKNYFTDAVRAEMGIKQTLQEKKVNDYELTACARDGKETVVSFNAATFYDRDRKLQGVFAAARDITERKRLDQVLQEKNVELESARALADKANLSKSEFLSSMSHELRSPLNAILGFAQLMESALPTPSETQKASLDQILKAGWYLLDLINEILDLALIESGRLSLSLEPMPLADVMSECQAMIAPQAQKKGISLSFQPLAMPYFVHADRTRVKQVILNLLSNAIKYNRVQGSVEVACAACSEQRIRISVHDTGEGLTSEQLEQLFQPFNRLGQESSIEEGTGIGLVVSKRLVDLMGGEIGVDSTVGVGSVFWFELTLVGEPQLEGGWAEILTPPPVKVLPGVELHTLLYIEDNQANMQLVEQIIERRSDMHLLRAEDGARGLGLARTQLPEVIMTDINLPGMTGIQVLRALQEDPLTAHIPVIAISANAMPHDIKKGLEAGFFCYLTKPIKVNDFMDALDKAQEYAKKSATDNKSRGSL